MYVATLLQEFQCPFCNQYFNPNALQSYALFLIWQNFLTKKIKLFLSFFVSN